MTRMLADTGNTSVTASKVTFIRTCACTTPELENKFRVYMQNKLKFSIFFIIIQTKIILQGNFFSREKKT